jgi:mRNA-degrading endonuclease YafQ of YafQ-DinJ toxin-antitoxin module
MRYVKYWWARLRNDFLRLTPFGPSEAQLIEEVLAKLKRDKKLAEILRDHGL